MRIATLLLIGCGAKSTPSPAATPVAHEHGEAHDVPSSLAFEEIGELPTDLDTLRVPMVQAKAMMGTLEVPLVYNILRRRGDGDFGLLHDRVMQPLHDDDAMCNEQDFNSILTVDGQPFLVSHFECTPGSMQISPLDQAMDGLLSIENSRVIDFSPVGGLWNPCAGQVSPWNTHLGSEEYEPNARAEPTPDEYWPHRSWKAMKRYQPEPLDPYRYGWIPEIEVLDSIGSTKVTKHLSPGRASHEIAYVLPDQRTVYLSDDGTKVGWTMFIADKPADLSAGHLYAARFEVREGGVLGVSWVSLGHAKDADLQPLLDRGLRFDELFEAKAPVNGACTEGYRLVDHTFGPECLKLAAPTAQVPDPAMAASRFETRRYSAYMGATTELEKGEGVTYDPATQRVFLAVTRIGKAMSDGKGHIDLPPNPCGVVYAGVAQAGVNDTDGKAIQSDLVHTDFRPTVVGRYDAASKRCAPDSIANPDNITYLPGYDQLVVAEDTSLHDNAFLWSFDREGKGVRLMVAPPYAEFTGVHWIPQVGDFGYLTVTTQHPWSEGDVELPGSVTPEDQRTLTGVLGPFPTLRAALPQAQ